MKLSIVVPTYNYARYLERCLLSVAQQTTPECELLVVDDGSSDNTREIVEKFCSERPEQNIGYFYQDNAGPSAARNLGARMANGEYLCFLDADDLLAAEAVPAIISAIDRFPQAGMIFFGYRTVNLDGRKTERQPEKIGENRTENFRRFILKRFQGFPTGAAIVKRDILIRIRFPEGVHSNEDTVFFAQIFANYPAVSVPGVVMETIRHPGSLRNDLQRIEASGLKAVECLFDSQLLTPQQMKLRPQYLANRCLSLFRTYYLHGKYARARDYYRQALLAHPAAVLQWSYFRKYLRCLWR
jgi:glycosyltransferase involved in cell wall biosynthesis